MSNDGWSKDFDVSSSLLPAQELRLFATRLDKGIFDDSDRLRLMELQVEIGNALRSGAEISQDLDDDKIQAADAVRQLVALARDREPLPLHDTLDADPGNPDWLVNNLILRGL